MHRITDRRLGGTSRKNVLLLKRLCGENFYPRVALVTTMWEELELQQSGEYREAQLASNESYWGDLYNKGSKILRHNNTQESALNIVDILLKNKGQAALAIQHELVDEYKTLINTAAGQAIHMDLEEAIKRYENEIRDLKTEIDDAVDREDIKTVDCFCEDVQRCVGIADQARQHQKDLHTTLEQLVEESEQSHNLLVDQLQELSQATLEQPRCESKDFRSRLLCKEIQNGPGPMVQHVRDQDRETSPIIVTPFYSSRALSNLLFNFSNPRFDTKLRELVERQVSEMDNLESIQQVKEMESELLYSRPQDIAFWD
ncbi:hypothetical protein ACHAPJ_010466 [Fusarium lateritium]